MKVLTKSIHVAIRFFFTAAAGICIFFFFMVFTECHFSAKAKKVQVGIPEKKLRNDWGVPDAVLGNGKSKALIYRKGWMGYAYIFEFDARQDTLTGIFIDD